MLSVVSKGPTYLADRDVNVLVGLDEDVTTPQSLDNLVAGNDYVPVLDQQYEQFKWQILQPDWLTGEEKLMPAEVEF
jgi:hypothetical protein